MSYTSTFPLKQIHLFLSTPDSLHQSAFAQPVIPTTQVALYSTYELAQSSSILHRRPCGESTYDMSAIVYVMSQPRCGSTGFLAFTNLSFL